MLYAFIVNYCIPLTFITYYYSQVTLYSLLAATIIEASSGTLNVWVFWFKSLRYLSIWQYIRYLFNVIRSVQWLARSFGTDRHTSFSGFQHLFRYGFEPINIRCIRTRLQPYWKLMYSLYYRQFFNTKTKMFTPRRSFDTKKTFRLPEQLYPTRKNWELRPRRWMSRPWGLLEILMKMQNLKLPR